MPGPPAGIGGSGLGISVTIVSVVMNKEKIVDIKKDEEYYS